MEPTTIQTYCRRDVHDMQSSRQSQIQVMLNKFHEDQWSIRLTFSQLWEFLREGFSTRVDHEDFYNCDANPEKTKMVATFLVSTWEQSQWLAERHGDNFLAILQPVAFVGSPNLEHLNPDNVPNIVSHAVLGSQYHAVYPLVKKEAEGRGINFLDLTDAYNTREFLYSDFCHVGSRGHEILVPKIIEGLKSKAFL